MILLIDWGNTCLKYVLLDEQESPFERTMKIGRAATLKEFVCLIKNNDLSSYHSIHDNECRKTDNIETSAITKTLITSVKNKNDNLQLSRQLEELGIEAYFAKTSKEACGVICGYDNPELLGVDRWLALIAGYENGRTIGIIDIGSAITLDIVNPVGQHLGGHIIPGLRLLNESLSNTANIRILSSNLQIKSNTLGKTTTECVNVGIESLIVNYLIQSIKSLSGEYNVDGWLMTGGDSEYYLNQIKSLKILENMHHLRIDQHLVFKGLWKLFE